ncbi:fibronectin type III domain-containing protein [Cryobacterium adonitolivorans]|uniref:Fibronectin type III domain-containing protein n=1 Tax=Cryobacterium adonitolivorans TaxID=1259189 RepID=A0A4R8W3J5_9MICO|nr:Ig-like domain-containing protein [Cryobacterium adonitolivorans]TFB99809.1 fibronectin type III domain-containing protein [Cryobacterium adonitolivorans]
MIRRWLGAHRSVVASVTGGTLVTALVVTVAVVSGGYTAEKVDLGDAAVWVGSETRQLVGRVNTEIAELNTVVPVPSEGTTVVQQGATVLMVDGGNGTMDILDPATATVTDSVALPPDAPEVRLAGGLAAISADGDLWRANSADLATFDSTTDPALALGTGTLFSLDDTGVLFGFTPATQTLVRIDPDLPDTVAETTTVPAGDPADGYQLSQVNGSWALLNTTTGILHLPQRTVDLTGSLTAMPRLQEPAVTGDRVLIAHSTGLISVPLDRGAATELLADNTAAGSPAAPVQDGRCAYAAWADGTAWQACGIGSPAGITATLAGLAGDARLEYRQNGSRLLLNDARNGATWNVQRDNELIDNWDDLIDPVSDQQEETGATDDIPPDNEDTQVPPVAIDDAFGARPGRTVTLPVLLNDYDPNGDVLVIDTAEPPPADQGRLDLVSGNQQLQLTLTPEASGSLSFDYSVSDGRGGVADATVTVTVRSPDENSAPHQARQTRASVAAGGSVESQVLGDWIDPDGDPFYLTAATASAPDTATSTPAGAVLFTDAGDGGDAAQVGLAVSDGSLTGAGTLDISVRPAGTVPIVADAFAVRTTAGSEVTVAPLTHVRGGSGPLRLGAVPDKPGVSIAADFAGGTFRFVSATVGVHYLDYAVTDGATTVTGLIRVDVDPAPDSPGRPITVPHTAFLRSQQPTVVDVLATDFDPAGGVLLVTATSNVSSGSGLTVEVLDQHLLRVTLTRPLESGTTSFGYTVSNGLAEATGTVTVIEIPAATIRQPPVAAADSVSVRVGDTIDIPVLANDEHPNGDALMLDPVLSTPLPAGAGLLFASGRVLRYLAPASTGNFTAVYRVSAPDGQFANAEVRISVRETDAATNNPPLPPTVTARVLAGDTVRIQIPRTGIDPDGDSVQLLGQETNPEKGTVTAVDADSLSYRAGDYSAGTDTFTYAVIDALGARATGTVRVGISPRPDGARNPVAVPDEVTVRPGSRVSVRVLGNDSDPDGGTLSITAVEATAEGAADGAAGTAAGTAAVDGDVVVVRAPNVGGRYGFVYQIQNERGGTGSAFLTVVVAADAPRAHPEADDTRLRLSDVLGRDTVDVDVLARVFFAEGSARDLKLAVLPGYDGAATVTDTAHIRVTVAKTSQIIPFSVSHPQDPGIVAYAFVWVPGTNDALPQLRAGAAKLVVASEATVDIDINDYVVAVGGKPVQLTDRNTVRATHANGAELSTGSQTLSFTSADRYFGPASISFEVTDGAGATDPAGRTATIVLPITVTPRENQPPAFDGAGIDFEPGQSKVIDLAKLTAYPYPEDRDELAFTVLDPLPTGFGQTLDGSLLTVTALEGTPKGSTSSVTIGVRDDLSAGSAGRIELRVVASTRPLALPATDAAVAPRGRSTVIDVLANDGATNPFPAVGLRVLAVRGLDSAALPAGVSITPSADNSRLTVRVSADAQPTDSTLQYQVADATNDPDRYTWGTVRVSVQDVPDAVTGLRATGFADGRITVAFNPGAANNSPITGYRVTTLDASSGRTLGSTVCAATSCTLATPGNGQANAVRVSVAAQNGIGTATAGTLAASVWSDVIPAAPTGLTAVPEDGAMLLGWDVVQATGGGTDIRGYQVSVAGVAQPEVSATGALCDNARCTLRVDGLANGTGVGFAVSARNDAYPALSSWNSTAATGTPYGAPVAGGITATATDVSGAVTVTWDGFADRGDAVAGYVVQRISGAGVPTGAQACSVSAPAPGSLTAPRAGGVVLEQQSVAAGGRSAVFDGLLVDDGSYSFVVWGHNRAGCVPSTVATVLVRPAPGAISQVQGAMEQQGDAWDYHLTGVSPSAGVDHYNIRAADGSGSGARFSGSAWPRDLLDLPFGSAVAFQLQACTVWGSCGPWSGTTTAPEASVTFTATGLAYDGAAGRFSWTGAPQNGSLAATFACTVAGSTSTPTPADSATTCTLPGPLPDSGTVLLTVTVDGHTFDFSRPIPKKAITP